MASHHREWPQQRYCNWIVPMIQAHEADETLDSAETNVVVQLAESAHLPVDATSQCSDPLSPPQTLPKFRFFDLPQDLQLPMLCHADQHTLLACRLVARALEPSATRIAFRRVAPRTALQLSRLAAIFVHAARVAAAAGPSLCGQLGRTLCASVRELDMRPLGLQEGEASFPGVGSDVRALFDSIDLENIRSVSFPEPFLVQTGLPTGVVEYAVAKLARTARNLSSLFLCDGDAMRSQVVWDSIALILPRLTRRLSLTFRVSSVDDVDNEYDADVLVPEPDPEPELELEHDVVGAGGVDDISPEFGNATGGGSRHVAVSRDPTSLGSWHRVECVDIAAWAGSSDSFLHTHMWHRLLPQLTSVTTFGLVDMSNTSGVTASFGPTELELLFLSAPNLRRLHIETDGSTDAAYARILATRGTRLTSLTIEGRVPNMLAVLASLENLVHVGLYLGRGTAPDGDEAHLTSLLARGALLSFDFFAFSSADADRWAKRVPAVLRASPGLRRLWIVRDTNMATLGTPVMEALADGAGPNLRYLRVPFSGHTRDSFEAFLATHWEKFPKLELAWIGMTDGEAVYERDTLETVAGTRVEGTPMWRLAGVRSLQWDSSDFLDPYHCPLVTS
ncbi:hypothetical protein M427DRAFT_27993 [Gonapodya prolifera JEL478]|uniref:Uncharacterized protein n=1 Tax=Gonapodya prolifera (strain JEL478) TaxID=1344416 RepID=A0A139AW23_GONPJ|nr:hypothetical protein M427DRAFT_27993 [Gonapodya prolifera JEL478]|eukprot:KXS20936.1 hypothetical protein M427DRAFT_27993 [Gonapodya prolifera JEL478]